MAGEWRTYRLGDVCSKIGSGATPRGGSGVYLEHGEIALIRSQNIHNDGFHHDGITYLTEEHAAELANVEVDERDVLLNITGDSVARSCQVDAGVLPARVNQHVAIIRPDPAVLWPRFLRYYLVSPVMQAEMLSLAGAGATRNALTKGMIELFEVPAPADIDEQRAIARILGTLDDKIELNRRMNDTLEAMARAIFKSWFVDTIQNGLPDGWHEDSVYAAASIIYGAPFASARFNAEKIGRPLIRIRDLAGERPGVFTNEEHPKGYLVKPGDIVVGMDGEFRAHLWGGEESWLNQRICVFVPKPGFSAPFLLNSIIGPLVEIETTETATTVIHLGKNDIDRFKIVVPDQQTLSRFNHLADPIFKKIVLNKQESRTLAALRDTLLPKIISRELRITDVDRIVTRQ